MKAMLTLVIIVLLIGATGFSCSKKAEQDQPETDLTNKEINRDLDGGEGETQIADNRVISAITASCNLAEYPVRNLWDGRLSTAWVAKGKPRGIGDWVQFDLKGKYLVQALEIAPGFNFIKNGTDLFTANSSLRSATLTFSDGSRQTCEFDGDKREYSIPINVRTNWVRLTITDIYPGVKWDDTCISEMSLKVAGED